MTIGTMARRSLGRTVVACVCAAAVLVASASARADAIKLDGIWYEDVQIDSIKSGKVSYVTMRGRVVAASVDRIEAMRLEEYPDLDRGIKALESNKPKNAVTPLKKVVAAAHDKWLKDYASYLLVRAYDEAGRGTNAATAYLALARGRTEPLYIASPPVASVANLPDDKKAGIATKARGMLGKADEATRVAIEQLLQAASIASAAAQSDAAPSESTTPAAARVVAGGPSAVVLPSQTPVNKSIVGKAVEQLRAGQFEAANQTLDTLLLSSGAMSEKLYLRGLARLSLADKSKDEQLYKDAALDFMRVVIHFPRSSYVGPATLEAGYAHGQWGDTDIRDRMYENAGSQFDPEEDAAYYQRFQKLTGNTGGE